MIILCVCVYDTHIIFNYIESNTLLLINRYVYVILCHTSKCQNKQTHSPWIRLWKHANFVYIIFYVYNILFICVYLIFYVYIFIYNAVVCVLCTQFTCSSKRDKTIQLPSASLIPSASLMHVMHAHLWNRHPVS